MDLRLSIILFVAISAVTLGAAVGLLWIMNRVLGKSPASRPGALPANSSRSSSTGPSCGRCGYSVRGATTLICPECGSDYREHGIATPDMRRPGLSSGIVKIILWTILLPIPAWFASTALNAALRPAVNSLRSTQHYTAASGDFFLTVETDIEILTWPWQPSRSSAPDAGRASVVFRFTEPQGRVALVALNPQTRTCSYKLPGTAQVDSAPWPIADDVVDWLTSLHIDVEDPARITEISAIMQLLDAFDTRIPPATAASQLSPRALGSSWSTSGDWSDSLVPPGLRPGGSGRSGSFLSAWPWFPSTLILIWFLLWLYGCWRFAVGAPFFPRRIMTAS